MKFIVNFNENIQNRNLDYLPDECSFDMTPIEKDIDFELILNKLSLSVIDNQIIQLWGFCGLGDWMIFNYTTPHYERGTLRIEKSYKKGFAYGINDDELPVFININTGWVCIGNPVDNPDENKAVEFINNCVAVVNNKKELISLWLKPLTLPNLKEAI